MPKVSVVIPTYNRADMLGDALDSVIQQSYTDWEAIVVDDGSSDDTQALMGRYTDPRIHYVYQTNKGLPGARNTGIRAAEGEYVALLDSDDVFLPERLQKQLALFEADPDLGLVVGGCIEVDAQLHPIREIQYWHMTPSLDLGTFLFFCPFCPSSVLVRRAWLTQAGYFDETMQRIEDWDMWMRMVVRRCKCVWLKEAVCLYRIHGGNMVRDVTLMRDGMLAMLDKLFAHDDLPLDIRAQRAAAFANVYLNTACRAYAAELNVEGKAALTRAIELDPRLLESDGAHQPPRVLNTFAAFSLMPICGDSEKFMDRVIHNLPESASGLQGWTSRRARGLVHVVAAFESWQRRENRAAAKHVLLALWRDPTWLRNRGLLRILSGIL